MENINLEVLKEAAKKNPTKIAAPFDTMLNSDGFEAICALTEQLGGLTVYVPKIRTIFARCLEIEAKKEYNGRNLIELSKKYGYTERHMRRLVGMS